MRRRKNKTSETGCHDMTDAFRCMSQQASRQLALCESSVHCPEGNNPFNSSPPLPIQVKPHRYFL
jgi:hypothetical protein